MARRAAGGAGGAARARLRLGLAGAWLALGCAGARDASLGVPSGYQRPPEYRGVVRTSRYVTVRDGVRLAVDLILPRNLPPGARIPALLSQGRYWRSVSLRGPARLMYDAVGRHGQLGRFKVYFVERGYAWLDVDTRGSGASFGTRLWDFSPDEIRDGADLVDWILRQPWSDGRVAAVGVSYSGSSAELLLANGHPAVRAGLPLFCDFDQYQDILAPGGVPHVGWVTAWAEFTRRLDRGILPFDAWWLRPFVAGVRPVDGDRRRKLLAEALHEHAANFDFTKLAEVVYRDDSPLVDPVGRGDAERAALARAEAWLESRFGPDFRSLGTDLASPHAYAAQVDAAGAPVYAYSGWLDGAYARAAARRFATLRHPGNKLLLGPWDHALGDVSLAGPRGPSRFDHAGELLRFLDEHVKGIPTGLAREARVHYFTMGAERWRAADTWPPPSRPERWYLAPGGALAPAPPTAVSGEDAYDVDFAAATGQASRWGALRGRPIGDPYPDRAERDRRLLVYTSPPLSAPLEVTGHPEVALHVAPTATDGAFFAYLEDVAPDGRVSYVTEGMLRALHRRQDRSRLDPLGLPTRTFRREDAELLVPGAVAELRFDLFPTSYVFAAGHSLRLALAGADADHFARIPPAGPASWRVQRSQAYPSRLILPVATPAVARARASE